MVLWFQAVTPTLTPVTVIETVAVLLSTVPSFALKVKLSLSLSFAELVVDMRQVLQFQAATPTFPMVITVL